MARRTSVRLPVAIAVARPRPRWGWREGLALSLAAWGAMWFSSWSH